MLTMLTRQMSTVVQRQSARTVRPPNRLVVREAKALNSKIAVNAASNQLEAASFQAKYSSQVKRPVRFDGTGRPMVYA